MDTQPAQTTTPNDNQFGNNNSSGTATNDSFNKSAVAATPNDKPTSDDEELAKVLAGLTTDIKSVEPAAQTIDKVPEISAVSAPAVADSAPALPPMPAIPPELLNSTPEIGKASAAPVFPSFTEPAVAPKTNNLPTELEDIRKGALSELRPLVSTLDLSPEEKFDIHLLLLRSTDDTTLITPAYEIAKQISDESKRAQALLDIIKEIDYLSNPE